MMRRFFSLWLVLLISSGGACAKEVYRSDFSKGISEKVWSTKRTHLLEPGGETVCGIFADQGFVRMDLGELPDHKLIRLRFDMLLSGGFDGNRGKNSADLISISRADGPLLWNGSICVPPEGRQSFPDEWPQGDHPAQTGRVRPDGAEKERMPQRYHFDLTFPHGSKDLAIIIRVGANMNGERWSFSNFVVDALPELQTLPAAKDKLDDLWGEFAGADPVVANKAVWRLIAAGEAGSKEVAARAVGDLGALTRKQTIALEKQFKEALAALAHDDFVKRQEGALALSKLDPAAIKLVDAAIAKRTTPAGVRTQLKRVRKKLEAKIAPKEAHIRLVEARIRHVQRVLGRERAGIRVTSSKKPSPGWDHECTVIDGFVPPISAMFHSPRFNWWPEKVGDGWLRLDFPAERQVSKFSVFWFWDDFGVTRPAGWKLEYLAADKKTWRPVANPSDYKTDGDKFNEVSFDKVKTSALRLVVTFNGIKSAGMHEIRFR